MPRFRLIYRGTGFAYAADPTGRQIINGFKAIIDQMGESDERARELGRERLLADHRIQHFIAETHEAMQEEGSWRVECEASKRLRLWRLRPTQATPVIDCDWTAPCEPDAEQAGRVDIDKAPN